AFIDSYFDTNVGKKGEAESYRTIAQAIGLEPEQIVFISDVAAELAAAKDAGMKIVFSIRPGNAPQMNVERYPSIHSFDEVR
ncbi:MAG TPA: HAD-IA family hydrolase, partial [Pyrinomonadaceae bacterium]